MEALWSQVAAALGKTDCCDETEPLATILKPLTDDEQRLQLVNSDVTGSEAKCRYTALHFASEGGKLNIVRYLAGTLGANVNARDKYLRTPLFWACQFGHVDVAGALIDEFGADIEAEQVNGLRPLHIAVYANQEAVVRLLLARGASRKAVTVHEWLGHPEGSTPLDIALYNGRAGIVAVLAEFSTSPASSPLAVPTTALPEPCPIEIIA